MPIRERILAMGITGSGKSYQWLKMAEILLPTGAIFRCLDTDNAIPFMLETQFPKLMPENGGNVYVHLAYDWPEYKIGVNWLRHKGLTEQQLNSMSEHLKHAYTTPIKDSDWAIVDMADEAWTTVQNHFVSEVFDEDAGDYFLEVRKELHARGGKSKVDGKTATSIMPEGLSGWVDWVVINKLYNDWIRPIVYQVPCHVYATTKVDRIDRREKDSEILMLFGDLGVKPTGQKKLGHQMHTVLLLIPGKDGWMVTTAKDRAGRPYFKKAPFVSFYYQYLVAKAGWSIPKTGGG